MAKTPTTSRPMITQLTRRSPTSALLLGSIVVAALGACSDSVDVVVTSEPPVPQFEVVQSAAVGETVRFDGSASTDSDGYIVTYSFVYGDLTPEELSADPVGTHVYAEPGLYEAELSVIDETGMKASLLTTISIQ